MGSFLFWSWKEKENKEITFDYLPIEQWKLDKIKRALDLFSKKQNEKLALVLPGGGALGAVQAGIIAYYYQLGVIDYVDLICGTSVGGLDTLTLAKNKKQFHKFIELWMNIKENKDVYDGILEGGFGGILAIIGQTFKDNGGKCILKPTGLHKILEKEFGDMKIKDLETEVVITATNYSTGKMAQFYSKMNENILCKEVAKMTSAIPIVFPTVEWNKDWYIDGGLGANSPITTAIENKATKILLIGTAPDNNGRVNIKNDVISVALRLEHVIMEVFEEWAWKEVEAYKSNPNNPTIEFFDSYPDFDGGSALDFKNCRENFIKGYQYAHKNVDIDKLYDMLIK